MTEGSAEASNTNMNAKDYTFQWMTERDNADVKLGISLNFDESNGKIEVAGIADKSLAGEKNRCMTTHSHT